MFFDDNKYSRNDHLAVAWPVRFIWSNNLDLEGKDYAQPLHFIELPLAFYS